MNNFFKKQKIIVIIFIIILLFFLFIIYGVFLLTPYSYSNKNSNYFYNNLSKYNFLAEKLYDKKLSCRFNDNHTFYCEPNESNNEIINLNKIFEELKIKAINTYDDRVNIFLNYNITGFNDEILVYSNKDNFYESLNKQSYYSIEKIKNNWYILR